MAQRPDNPYDPDTAQTVPQRDYGGPIGSTDFAVDADRLGTLGDYDLLDEIGSGGMGRVFRARQRSRDRVVALKTLLPRYVATPALLARFRQEAEAAAQLNHPGIVPVYKIDEADGHVFFTMALVEGQGLDERVRQGPLGNRRAALIVQRVAEAVAHAHTQNVVHRDLKPGNILLDHDGGVKVTDFGLARRLDVKDFDIIDEHVRTAHPEAVGTVLQLTKAGAIMGTPGFMAPEQATPSAKVGPLADVWALGAVLYSCLTGRPPFVGADAVETLALTIEAAPVPPTEINPDADPELAEICLRCLRKDPAERFPSADEVAKALAQWREGQSARTRGEIIWVRTARFLAASPELVPLVAGLVIQRLGNMQEGIFAGCALAGIGLTLRRSGSGSLIAGAAAVAGFLVCLPLSGFIVAGPAWLPGAAMSLAALVAMTVVIGGGVAALEPARPGRWSPRGIAGACLGFGVFGAGLSVAAALTLERLADVDPAWRNFAVTFERYAGRGAGWLLAVPLGLAVGALLGRVNALLGRFGREPAPAFMLGGALLTIAAVWAIHELRPPGTTEAARFSAAGPGPALSTAEGQLKPWLGYVAEARLAAAAGAFWLKMLFLIAPLLIGGFAAGLATRLSVEDRR